MLGLFAAAAAGWAQTPQNPQQELAKLENAWKQAVVNRDKASLERLYTADYTSTDTEGMTWNRGQDIEIDMEGPSHLTSFSLDDLKVQVVGDVAVVTGRNTATGTLVGKKVSAKTRFTDVFVKRDGRWQCMRSQSTAIIVE